MISTIRIIEDSLGTLILSGFLILMLHIIFRRDSNRPAVWICLSLFLALLPFWFWKTLGAFRRLFLDSSAQPELYEQLYKIGEMFESLSAVTISIAIIFLIVLVGLTRFFKDEEFN